jgi:hypothetical protein
MGATNPCSANYVIGAELCMWRNLADFPDTDTWTMKIEKDTDMDTDMDINMDMDMNTDKENFY